MRRRTFAGLAATIAAALLLTTPAPATADPIIWRPAPCATGEITQHTIETSGQYPTIKLMGWIKPCPETEQTNGFAIMYHSPNANMVLALQPYESADAPTLFVTGVSYSPLNLERWAQYGGLRGMCLVRSYEHWLSCVTIEPGTDNTPQVTPVSPHDWRLQAPVVLPPPGSGSHPIVDPNCGTCASPGPPTG